MMHYLLFYDVAADFATRRMPFRTEHLTLATDALRRGELLLGGALSDPVDAAVLVFRADSSQVVENFVKADPYVRNGLVRNWSIREWIVTVGQCDPPRALSPGPGHQLW